MNLHWQDLIEERKEIMLGKPVFKGTRLTVEHVMASSALPFIFPAVDVDGHWYGDGGIRLTAPLSPAVHLGATRIIAVSTRWPRRPVTRPDQSPSIIIRPSSTRPRSPKNEIAVSRDCTTIPTLSMR